MKIDDWASDDVHTVGGGETPPCIGLTPNALPDTQHDVADVSTQVGVSTRCALSRCVTKQCNSKGNLHWYVLRTTYGREKKAYDYLIAKGITAFLPSISVVKLVKGKRRIVTRSRLPNIFFAYATEEQLKTFVYDNVNLPFLRFYYHYFHIGDRIEKAPLVVPNSQMESLRIICAADAADIIVSSVAIPKFEKGQLVRIVEGTFQGVVGRVARYQGQQRVAVEVKGLLTVCTAYVPSGFIESVEE